MLSKNVIKLSAAGSGKTWGICNDALAIITYPEYSKRILITTYTNKGVETIEKEIRKQNQGVLDPRIIVYTWYQFLLTELIRPYQTCIAGINEIKSFDFSKMYGRINYQSAGDKRRYISVYGNVLANQASELAILLNHLSKGRVVSRQERIYSHIFIDEIQDMVGNDLEIISLLINSKIATICVGDNKQATYCTHNTSKNKKQTGKNIWEYFSSIHEAGKADLELKLVSRRFNKEICSFANQIYPNGNRITTEMTETTDHDGVYLILRSDVCFYYNAFFPTVLKYDKNTDTDGFESFNFGQCKGVTFDRVLVYPNGPLNDFIYKGKQLNCQQKYYVAVTRPRYSIAFAVNTFPRNEMFTEEVIHLDNMDIKAMRFICGERK